MQYVLAPLLYMKQWRTWGSVALRTGSPKEILQAPLSAKPHFYVPSKSFFRKTCLSKHLPFILPSDIQQCPAHGVVGATLSTSSHAFILLNHLKLYAFSFCLTLLTIRKNKFLPYNTNCLWQDLWILYQFSINPDAGCDTVLFIFLLDTSWSLSYCHLRRNWSLCLEDSFTLASSFFFFS